MNKKNLLVVLLTVITVIYYFPIINFPLDVIDESFILVGADRILKGQIPHKDFSSEYPVGQLYTLAALFKVFGTSVITERVYDILIKSFLSLIMFLIVRFVSSGMYAFIGWVMSIVWVLHSSAPAYPGYQSILFIYISVYWILLHIKKQKNYYVVLSAIFIVIAVLFRHDFGGYAAIAITIVLLFRKIAKVQSWTPTVLFMASGVMAGLPVIIYLIMNSGIEPIINDLILIPTAMREYHVFPYPSLSRWNLPFYMFPLVLLTGVIASIVLIKRKTDDTRAYAILLISLVGMFCLNQVKMRSDNIHLLPVALTGILLAPILLYTLSREVSLSTWPKRAVYLLFVFVFGITLSKPIEDIKRILSRTSGYIVKNVNPDYERAKYSIISEEIKNVVSYIKMNTSKDEYLYVGVKNHDQFVFSDILIYFLADRNYASRYHALNPGVQTTLKVQNEMINEFKENRPRLVVLGSRTWNEPNLSSIDTKVDVLDNYISSNFELKKTYGPYEIWMDKKL